MKKWFDNNIKPLMEKKWFDNNYYIIKPLMDENQEAWDEIEFSRLAQKYMHHDEYSCTESGCLIGEGLGYVINGQGDLDHAHYEKQWEYATDEMPF